MKRQQNEGRTLFFDPPPPSSVFKEEGEKDTESPVSTNAMRGIYCRRRRERPGRNFSELYP